MKRLTNELKEEIVEYCRETIKKLNIKYLKDNDVYKNEFLEFLYLTCIETYIQEGDYKVSDEILSVLFSVKKHNELYMRDIKSGVLDIKGIDKNDNLIIEK